jgi:hypothetical protein
MKAVELGIKTKKVVYRGEKCYKILSYGCYELEDDRLPHRYFENFPFCFVGCDDEFVVVTNDKSIAGKSDSLYSEDDNYIIEVGGLVPKEEFEKLVKIVRVCGEKLHTINQEIKEMKKEWQGEEEFKI